MTRDLLHLTARGEPGVFVVRQRGREVATALGYDQADQVRLATALSEVCRHLLAGTRTVSVTFRLIDASVDVALTTSGPVDSPLQEGVQAAARLMDRVELTETAGSVTIVLNRRLAPYTPVPDATDLDRIRTELSNSRPASVLEELGVQNTQLITALEEVQRHRDELLSLNAELAETNQGVMALYSQLSEEMEQTNRGVVALYAELDERTAQLREASEAKSRFLRNVSHELRAPVTAIIGMVRLVLHPGSDPLTGEQAHQMGLIQSSAGDLLALVNELLDLAKAESNRLEPQWGAVDLREVFSQLRGTLRHLARPDVELVVDAEPDVPPLITDGVLLVQVLRNLLTNGLKFTGSGEVRLTATYDPATHRITLAVSDTGIGIAPDDLDRVFEEFYQVRDAQRPATPGTGLGLPYARRLCALLGGTLEVRSTPGVGSTFTVSIPRTPAEVDIAPLPAPNPDPPRTVLVVDDDAAFRHRLRRALEADDRIVTEAADGRAALAAMRAQRPDVVLLDLRMSGMGGLELLGELAADPRLADVPVLIVTAAELDEVARAATGRAAGVLDKATLTDELLTATLRATAPGRRA